MAAVVTQVVRDIMRARPSTVQPDSSIEELLALMRRDRVGTCPVVRHDGELVGIVSRVDLLRGLRPSPDLRVADPAQFSALPVREIMRAGVVAVQADDPLVAALDLMVKTRLHGLPVVQHVADRRELIGLVTQEDLLDALLGTPCQGP
jgi:CBS domain-containing protein